MTQLLRLLLIQQKQISEVLIAVVSAAAAQIISLATNQDEVGSYHTSILSGEEWVKELLTGHPERIRCELGVHKHVFDKLILELRTAGYTDSRSVKLEEQLAIFLYMCVTGLTLRHVGEQFQRTTRTVSKYFKKILYAFISAQIYGKYVQLPCIGDPVPQAITSDPRFWPYFEDAIGAIDGAYIPCMVTAKERDASRNRKGFISQNCLICCDFDLRFTYVCSGWEGSGSEVSVYRDVCVKDLVIPPGKYYLADAGFPNCQELLAPFRGGRYRLAKSGHAGVQPLNRREYSNLHHAQLRNVVERIMGVVKRRFRILVVPPEFNMDIQARIFPACCCIHNIIRIFDHTELNDMELGGPTLAFPEQGPRTYGALAESIPTTAGRDTMTTKRDDIAMNLWSDYTSERARRGEPVANLLGD